MSDDAAEDMFWSFDDEDASLRYFTNELGTLAFAFPHMDLEVVLTPAVFAEVLWKWTKGHSYYGWQADETKLTIEDHQRAAVMAVLMPWRAALDEVQAKFDAIPPHRPREPGPDDDIAGMSRKQLENELKRLRGAAEA